MGGGAARIGALATVVTVACLAAPVPVRADRAAEADPMVGTLVPGFTVPGAATPFGMVQNSPDTRGYLAYSGYQALDPGISAFSVLHLSGPGVSKGGDIPLMPVDGAVTSTDPARLSEPFDRTTERASPGAYAVTLLRSGIRVDLAATTRTALQRYTFPAGADPHVLLDAGRSNEGTHPATVAVTAPDELSGSADGRYTVHFVARFDHPFTATTRLGPGAVAAAFDTRTVNVAVGVSFSSVEAARRNLDAEQRGFDIAATQSAARAAWNRELGALTVDGGDAHARRTFTTALYHALLHPNVLSDAGRPVRYANFSSWDTYKSQNQLLTEIAPARVRGMLRSLLDVQRRTGRLPRWGEWTVDAAHMSGDPVIPFIADAACRGLLSRGLTLQLLRAAAATAARRNPLLDRLGYLPMEAGGSSAGTTLEYGIADFAGALVADRLGHRRTAATWLKRSLRYRNLLSGGFVRPRHADGSWLTPFDPEQETGFQEGNSWQYSWLAPHDARHLFAAMGGDARAVGRLREMFRLPPPVAGLTNLFGTVYRTRQYAPGNEHDLQVPWMAALAGAPWLAAESLARIRNTFSDAPGGLPGNDDLGGLSAWYLWAALGIGPVTPGAPFYVIGSPQFTTARMRLGSGRTFTISAPQASPLRPYVTAASLDGHRLDRAYVTHAELARGGTLTLTMSSRPDHGWGTTDRPPVLDATNDLTRFGCR